MKWFDKLTSQEQNLIKVGFIILLPVVIWKFVYQPITETYQAKIIQKQTLENHYQEMLSSRELLKQQQIDTVKFHRDNNQPFISWIDEQLIKNQLSQFVVRSEPKDNQTLILTFESVVFDELVGWLEPLENNFGIKISEVDVNLTNRDSGLCNARITIKDNK